MCGTRIVLLSEVHLLPLTNDHVAATFLASVNGVSTGLLIN